MFVTKLYILEFQCFVENQKCFSACTDSVPQIINGSISAASDNPPYFIGESVTYNCVPGFTINNPAITNECIQNLISTNYALWSRPSPSNLLPACRKGYYDRNAFFVILVKNYILTIYCS